MRTKALTHLAILVVVSLPVGAALTSNALIDEVAPVVPTEVRIGGTDPAPAGGGIVHTPPGRTGDPVAEPDLRIVVVSQLPPVRGTDDRDDDDRDDEGDDDRD